MNFRALTLGAIVGFVVAFSPACSPAKCGPQNCDGCCDAKGVCTKKPSNNNNTTCGSAGNACVDCTASGSTCDSVTSTCTTGTGAGGGTGTGGGTGGGTASCDGCILPSSGMCRPLSLTSVTNCGVAGATCRACASGELCTNGVCGVPDAGVAAIATSCTVDADCSTIAIGPNESQFGFRPFCKKTAVNVGGTTPATYTGGHCTKRCVADDACGTGNECVYVLGDLGEADNICMKSCTSDAQCRESDGYFCLALSQTGGVCVPGTLFDDGDGGFRLNVVDAGPGFPGVAGDTCTSNTSCQPPTNGFCIPESFDAGYFGGACTAECTGAISNDSWCGDAGVCIPSLGDQDSRGYQVAWFCERLCGTFSDGGVAGTCRDEHACDKFTATSTLGTCVPKCTNHGASCPRNAPTCNTTTGLCQ